VPLITGTGTACHSFAGAAATEVCAELYGPDGGSCESGYTLGACPSAALVGCCVPTGAGNLAAGTDCYYNATTAGSAQAGCTSDLTLCWQTTAP
jgi:hypothetical protein